MNPFSPEARAERRLARLQKLAGAFSSSPSMAGDQSDELLDRRSLPSAAIRLASDFLGQLSWPIMPQLVYRGVRTATRDESTPAIEADAQVILSAHIVTLTGCRRDIELPIVVRAGKLLEPSVMVVDGVPRIIAQSLVDEITRQGTFKQKVDPRGGMYSPPLDQEAYDAYNELDEAFKSQDRYSQGIFSVASVACASCRIEKPATPEFFHRNSNKQNGLHPVCKSCRVVASFETLERRALTAAGMKRCGHCREVKPATTDYFSWDTERGLHGYCKPCARSTTKAWCLENPDKRAETAREWEQDNSEKRRAQERRRYAENLECRERKLARTKVWVKEHPEISKAGAARYKARKLQAPGNHTAADIRRIFADQRGMCLYCGVQLLGRYHVDHMVPLSRGGSNSSENLCCTCARCNVRKRNRTSEEFMVYLANNPIIRDLCRKAQHENVVLRCGKCGKEAPLSTFDPSGCPDCGNRERFDEIEKTGQAQEDDRCDWCRKQFDRPLPKYVNKSPRTPMMAPGQVSYHDNRNVVMCDACVEELRGQGWTVEPEEAGSRQAQSGASWPMPGEDVLETPTGRWQYIFDADDKRAKYYHLECDGFAGQDGDCELCGAPSPSSPRYVTTGKGVYGPRSGGRTAAVAVIRQEPAGYYVVHSTFSTQEDADRAAERLKEQIANKGWNVEVRTQEVSAGVKPGAHVAAIDGSHQAQGGEDFMKGSPLSVWGDNVPEVGETVGVPNGSGVVIGIDWMDSTISKAPNVRVKDERGTMELYPLESIQRQASRQAQAEPKEGDRVELTAEDDPNRGMKGTVTEVRRGRQGDLDVKIKWDNGEEGWEYDFNFKLLAPSEQAEEQGQQRLFGAANRQAKQSAHGGGSKVAQQEKCPYCHGDGEFHPEAFTGVDLWELQRPIEHGTCPLGVPCPFHHGTTHYDACPGCYGSGVLRSLPGSNKQATATVDQVVREVSDLKDEGYDDISTLLAISNKYPSIVDAVMEAARDKGLLDLDGE